MDIFVSGEFKAIVLWLWMISSLFFLIDTKKNYKKIISTSLLYWFAGFILGLVIVVDYSPKHILIWGIVWIFSGIALSNAIEFKKKIMPYVSEHILIIASILTINYCSRNLLMWDIIVPIVAIVFAIITIHMLVWNKKISNKRKLSLYKWYFIIIPILLIIQIPDISLLLLSNSIINNLDLFAKGYLFTYTVIHILYIIDLIEAYKWNETTKEMKKRIAEQRKLIYSKFSDKQISIKELIVLSILITWVMFLNRKFQVTSDAAIVNMMFFLWITRNQFILKKKNYLIKN